MPHVWFDERVVREMTAPGVIEEIANGREICREPAAQARCVDDSSERQRARRIAVDPPCETFRLQTLEERFRSVVDGKRVRWRKIDHVAGSCRRMEEGAVREGLRWHFAEPMVEGGEPASQRRSNR